MPPEVQILRVTLLALIGLAAPLGAQADVNVQERGTLSISNINVQTTSTQQIAGERERTESDPRCQGTASLLCGKNQQIDIIRLDRGVIWKLEPRNRRYIETSLLTGEQRRSFAERSRAASAERRPGFLSGLGMFLLSSVPFVEASIAIRLHQRVNLGTASNSFFVPPPVAILFGVFVALVGCLVMYLSVRRGPIPSNRQPDEF